MEVNKLTIGDLKAIADLLDKQTAVLATKDELEVVRLEMATKEDLTELRSLMIEGFEIVMQGVDNLVTIKPKI